MALLNFDEYLLRSECSTPILDKAEGPEITMPDEALTIVEIIQRYSRGIPLPTREGIYDEDIDLIDEPDDLQALSDVIDMQDEMATALHKKRNAGGGTSSEDKPVEAEQAMSESDPSEE